MPPADISGRGIKSNTNDMYQDNFMQQRLFLSKRNKLSIETLKDIYKLAFNTVANFF